jgi:hypothetical protein
VLLSCSRGGVGEACYTSVAEEGSVGAGANPMTPLEVAGAFEPPMVLTA